MSEENKGSAQDENSSADESPKLVPQKVAEDYKNDMFKYKSKTKELEAIVNEYQMKIKQSEEDKLAEKEQWKELYEKQKEEYHQLQQEANTKEQTTKRMLKTSALKQELGSIKDAYLVHADIDSVQFNEDGTINSESLQAAANQFRQDHSDLIQNKSNGTPTQQAAPVDGSLTSDNTNIKQKTKADLYGLLNDAPIGTKR